MNKTVNCVNNCVRLCISNSRSVTVHSLDAKHSFGPEIKRPCFNLQTFLKYKLKL